MRDKSVVRHACRRYSLSLLGMVAGALPLRGQGIASSAVPSQATPQAPLVVRGVTVIDVHDGTRLTDQTVVIVGNRIQTLGATPAVPAPRGARVVDGRGKYLIPGLWDMHFHLLALPDVFYPLLLANGVTGIRDMGTGVRLDTLHQWRREILAGTRVGPPRQLFAGPVLDEVHSTTSSTECWQCYHGISSNLNVHDSAHVRYVVDSLQAAGADFIKVHSMTFATYWALVAEAHRVGIPFAGHLPEIGNDDTTTVLVASDSGQRTIEHMYGIFNRCLGPGASLERCRPIAERHRRNDTWDVLSPAYVTGNARQPLRVTGREAWRRLRFLPDSVTRDTPMPPDSVLDRRGMLAKKPLHLEVAERAGLPLLIGTDHGIMFPWHGVPGFALHDDLAAWVAQGLTPLAALQAVTLNPARMLHATDSLGAVAPGQLADLVLLDADPLADIWNTTKIQAVIADGRYYDRAVLDQILAALEAAAHRDRAVDAAGRQKPERKAP